MRYSAKDLERSRRSARERALYHDQGIAELIATVRRETVEECARICDNDNSSTGRHLAEKIRALLDEPKCANCGDRDTDTHGSECDRFEPEEPGHG